MMKLKPSKPYKVGKTQNHGQWITNAELDIMEKAITKRVIRFMTVVGIAIIKKDIGKIYRNKDYRADLWLQETVKLMACANNMTPEMLEAETELERMCPDWQKK